MKSRLINSKSIEEVIKYVPFEVKVVADYNTYWGKNYADITNVVFVLKKQRSDSNNSFLKKEMSDAGNDVSIEDSTKTFTIKINQDDFNQINTETYSIRIGVLFNGESQFRDLGEIENGLITIKESWIDYIDNQQ